MAQRTLTRERRELNQRRGREETWILVGQVLLFLIQATCILKQFGFFNLADRGGGFSACLDPQRGQCAL